MATMNPFDLLGDDDAEDPSQLIAAQQQKLAAAPKKAVPPQPIKAGAQVQETKPAKLPSKPAPPAQAEVRDAKNEAGRGGGRGGGRGYGYSRGRGGGGYNRDSSNYENTFSNSGAPPGQGALEDGDGKERHGYGGPRGPYRGGRRGDFGNAEVGDGERRRVFERRSGTGRGSEVKREGSGRGNWGSQADELSELTEEVANVTEKHLGDEKPVEEGDAADGKKDTPANEPEEKEPEDKEMTLEEYQKVLEEKRKALQALKTTEERKVDAKEFESFQQLSNKKANDEIFIKLGSDKDKKKDSEKEEKSKKSVSINEFLKPAEGERFYNPGGRGRGRGRGSKGGGFSSNYSHSSAAAPSIEDPGQFPTLGGK
ncbi:unnamed protein product [Malus baccata var. baccata]